MAYTYITALNINGSAAYQLYVAGDGAGGLPIGLNGTVCIHAAYKLPTVDGTAGQVICTDGAGTLGWGTGGGGGGWCGTAGSDLNMNGYQIYGASNICGSYICGTTCVRGGCLCSTGNIRVSGDIFSCGGNAGVASSPGAFKAVNASCGMFTTCVNSPYHSAGAGTLGICANGSLQGMWAAACLCLVPIRVNGFINPGSSNAQCIGQAACYWLRMYAACFCVVSDREKKTNFQNADTSQVLNAFENLPLCSWEYKCSPVNSSGTYVGEGENKQFVAGIGGDNAPTYLNCGDGKKKIGPVADDYYKAFKGIIADPVDEEDKGFDLVQKSGLQDAAIKELIKCIRKLEKNKV